MQFIEKVPWISSLGISYHMGVDGISVLLIMLTTLLSLIIIPASWNYIKDREMQFFAAFLFLETGMIGVFCARDLLLFYVFWEVMLIPMYFIIGVWGGPRRIYAAVKFFLFTFAGSLLMLIAIVAIAYLARPNQYRDAGLRHGPAGERGLLLPGAVLGLPGVLPRLRGQGADVAAAYLAARRPRRGADGRQRHPGRRAC